MVVKFLADLGEIEVEHGFHCAMAFVPGFLIVRLDAAMQFMQGAEGLGAEKGSEFFPGIRSQGFRWFHRSVSRQVPLMPSSA